MTQLWYYTTGKRLTEILQAGELAPTGGLKKAGKAVLWFSSNPEWDMAANEPWKSPDGAMTRLTKDQTHVLYGGLARIGIPMATAPLDWKAFKRESGISTKAARDLYNAAIAAGSRPGEWHATFEKVPRDAWTTIEILEGETWVTAAL